VVHTLWQSKARGVENTKYIFYSLKCTSLERILL
jgi:hypothetical protein